MAPHGKDSSAPLGPLKSWLKNALPSTAAASDRRSADALRLAITLHLFATVPFLVLLALAQQWQLTVQGLPLLFVYGACFTLLRKGKPQIAAVLFLFSLTLAVVVCAAEVGPMSRLDLALLYPLVAPPVLLPPRKTWLIGLCSAMPAAGYLALHAWGYSLAPSIALGPFEQVVLGPGVTATAALIVVSQMFLLLRRQVAAEEALIEARNRAEASSEAKSRFMAMVSHELRTPLHGVTGNLSLIPSSGLSPAVQKHVTNAQVSAELLAEAIDDLLDFSAIERGLFTLRPKPTQVAEKLESYLEPIRKAAINKGLGFNFVTVGEANAWLTVDARRLCQIAGNLTSNAVKFTQSGRVSVELQIVEQATKKMDLLITVSDTGAGLSAAQAEKLFEPFSHRSQVAAAEEAGLGLGLAITRGIAQAMGGSLDLNSTQGMGSSFTFSVSLPKAAAPAETVPTAGARLEAAAPRTPDTLSMAVMVAEDVEMNQVIAKKMLESLGCTVDVASNGAEAVALANERHYDAIFMDLQMPVMDGINAARTILAQQGAHPANKRSPYIIALTANVYDETKEECFRTGMQHFVGKPYKRKEIQAALEAAKKHQQDA